MKINSGSLHSTSSFHITSNQIRIYDSIKHELSEWLWKFFHYPRFIFTIVDVLGNAKRKFNIFVDYLNSNREDSKWPLSPNKCDIYSHCTQYDFFLSREMLRIIKNYLSWMDVMNMLFLVFLNNSNSLSFHYINLFYVSWHFLLFAFWFWYFE